MTNLALKLAVVSGFAGILTLQGDPSDLRRSLLAEASLDALMTAPSAPEGSPSPATALRPSSRTGPTPARPPQAPAPPPFTAPAPDPLPSGGERVGVPRESPAHPPSPAAEFAGQMVRLSAEADAIDRLWLVYKAECGVQVARRYDFGREWFSIWDRAAVPTLDRPGCADILWRLLQAGETVRRELARARATAQNGLLDQGTEVGMLRWHSLQWP